MTEENADLLTGDANPDQPDAKPADAPAPAATDAAVDTKAGSDAQQQDAGDLLSGDEGTGNGDVPDKYTFDPPEGFDVNEDFQGRLEEFNSTAKQLGLSQEQYQKLVEYDIQRGQHLEQAAVDGWNQRVSGWREAARADKEIGGEHFKTSLATAQKVVDNYADAELRKMLKSPSPENPDGLALGNHPAMLRLLNRIGRALEDPPVLEGDSKVDDEGTLRKLYPTMFDKSA